MDVDKVKEAERLMRIHNLAPVRAMEQRGWIKGSWARTEANREAKFYSLTKAGEKALAKEAEKWRRLAGLVDKLLLES